MAALTQLKPPITFATQQRNENNNKDTTTMDADNAESMAASVENGTDAAAAAATAASRNCEVSGGNAVTKWLESIHLQEYEDVFR